MIIGAEQEDRLWWTKTKGQNCHLRSLYRTSTTAHCLVLIIRLMADLILSLEIVVWLQIRIKATDDNIYSMKEESDFFFLWLPAESLSSVQSEMFCLQPEWQTPFNHIKSGLFTCQAEHTHWQHNFSPSASHCSLLLNSTHHYDQKGTEMEKEKKETFMNPQSLTPLHLSSPPPLQLCLWLQ